MCGCGGTTPLALHNKDGLVRGEHTRFLRGHVHRVKPPKRRPLEERFWQYVQKGSDDECWEWTGQVGHHRYGTLYDTDRKRHNVAHRISYELFVGSIPKGLTIDHLCRNRRCVNPAHLEAVTMRENVLRSDGPTAINARKTHCLNGHPYDEENTLVSARGGRDCRTCRRERQRRQRKAAA